MSHRVTTQTEIKDKEIAINALQLAKMSYEDSGDNLRITSGDLRNAVIDLNTGLISGDTDYRHNPEKLGALRQFYGEAKYRAECLKTGISITGRELDKEGNIVLMCRMM